LVDLTHLLYVDLLKFLGFFKRETIELLLNLLNLKHQSLVWVYSLLKQQKVVCFLKINKVQIILTHLRLQQQNFWSNVHFYASDMRFFVLSEKHIHDILHLCNSFVRLELEKLLLLSYFRVNKSRKTIVNALAVLALKLNLFVVPACAVDSRVDAVNRNHLLWKRLCRKEDVLVWQFNSLYIKVCEAMEHVVYVLRLHL